MRRGALVAVVLLATAASLLTACGATSQTTPLTFADVPTLRAERDEWRGERAHGVWLRRHVRVVIDTATDPSRATSTITVHAVRAHYAQEPGRAWLELPVPAGAQLVELRMRRIRGDGAAGVIAARAGRQALAVMAIPLDPEQGGVRLSLGSLSVGEIAELLARFEVSGTLASDARWLASADAPTAEVLISYELPSHAVASVNVQGSDAKPLVRHSDGTTVIALRVTKLPKLSPAGQGSAHIRYVTQSAAPKNYSQRYFASWSDVLKPFREGLVAQSTELRQGFQVPKTASGPGALAELFAWVQGLPRPARERASSWRDARPLAEALRANDASANERVHLLHWLLEAAGVGHTFAVARPVGYPRVEPTFAYPDLFDTPLLRAADGTLLDPGCSDCALGEVRRSLRGGQAVVLGSPELVVDIPTFAPADK